MRKKIKIRPIQNGTVIDHIEGGQGLSVLKIMDIDAGTNEIISMVINVESEKMGRKDIVKIENRFLDTKEIDKISLISPKATVNIIKNSVVVEKHKVELPDSIEGMIKCQNPNCISNDGREPAMQKFVRSGETVRCFYCDAEIEPQNLVKALI